MKYFINVVAIIIIVILVFSVIQIRKNPSEYPFRGVIKIFLDYIAGFVKAVKHNVGMEMSPPRKPNLTFIEREAALREYLPMVFGQFSEQDWKKFWALIYVPIEKKQGKFKIKTYRTKEELEDYLRQHYPNPFDYFKEEHWYDFWGIARINWEEQKR